MANIRSSAKRNRQNEKRRLRNKGVRSRVQTEIRKLMSTIDNNNKEEAQNQYRKVSGIIDSAVGKGAFHPNNAARKKSRLQKKVNQLVNSE